MKVLIFSTAYLPFVGGAELAIKEITGRLPNVSFSLITARFKRGLPASERIGNIEVYRVGFGFWFDKWFLPFLGFWSAKRLARENNFDVVWSVMASQASIAAARFKKSFPDKKLVLTLQEGDEEKHLKRYVFGSDSLYCLFIRPWHFRVFNRADAITAISMHLAKRAQKNLSRSQAGNSQVPIFVIPNGVDVEKFKAKSEKRKIEELRQKLGIKTEDKIIITTSRLVKKNGIADLIAAMQYLPENVKLLICGTGPLEKRYKLQVARLFGGSPMRRLQTRIIFLGHIPHEQLPQFLHIADVFVRPSLSEGMGSSFLEAMAAGVPVVATRTGGIPDFLKNGETGLFCEMRNPQSIAMQVRLLLGNDAFRNILIENALQMVRAKYGWERITGEMQKVLSEQII